MLKKYSRIKKNFKIAAGAVCALTAGACLGGITGFGASIVNGCNPLFEAFVGGVLGGAFSYARYVAAVQFYSPVVDNSDDGFLMNLSAAVGGVSTAAVLYPVRPYFLFDNLVTVGSGAVSSAFGSKAGSIIGDIVSESIHRDRMESEVLAL